MLGVEGSLARGLFVGLRNPELGLNGLVCVRARGRCGRQDRSLSLRRTLHVFQAPSALLLCHRANPFASLLCPEQPLVKGVGFLGRLFKGWVVGSPFANSCYIQYERSAVIRRLPLPSLRWRQLRIAMYKRPHRPNLARSRRFADTLSATLFIGASSAVPPSVFGLKSVSVQFPPPLLVLTHRLGFVRKIRLHGMTSPGRHGS